MNRDRRSRAAGRQGTRSGERYAQIPEEILQSEAYGALPDYARVCIVAIASRFTGHNNGDLSLSEAEAKSRGVSPKWKLRASVKLLEACGLIAVTRRGRLSAGGKLCSLYGLTWRELSASEKYDQPIFLPRKASNDWAKWSKPDDWNDFVRDTAHAAKGKSVRKKAKKIPVTPQSGTNRTPQSGTESIPVAPHREGHGTSSVVPPGVVTS